MKARLLGAAWLSALIMLLAFAERGVSAYTHLTLPFDPSLDWQTLETEHFLIVFPKGLLSLGEEAAEIAERAYDFWVQRLGYAPSEKTYIVLEDQSDVTAVHTRLFPHNVIVIDHPFSSLEPWGPVVSLESLIFSEYGHIVDQTRVGGLTGDLRAVLGKLISPGLVKPLMLREGLAGLIAEDKSMEGIVFALTKDHLPTLAQLSTPYERVDWPPSWLLARAVGGLMLRYLEETYGPKTLQKLSGAYAERPLASATLGALALITNKPAVEIYKDFRAQMRERFSSFQREVEAQGGLTPSNSLSPLGFLSLWPAWSPDGSSIVYYHWDPQRLAGLRLIKDGEDEALLPCECGPPAWLDEITLVYPKLEVHDEYKLFYDLYRYDLLSQREVRLTYGERIYIVKPFPDGKTVLVARNEYGGRSSLVLFDLVSRSRLILKEFDARTRIHSLAVSPDGRWVALSIWKQGQGQDIYLMGSWGGELIPLTQDPASDLDPAFSSDGGFVLFTSDRAGVFDIYAFSLEDHKLFRVTRSLFGSLQPAISSDGQQLLFVSLGPEGFRIGSTDYDPEHWRKITFSEATYSLSAPEEQLKRPFSPKPYDAGEALLPTFWLPLIGEHVALFTSNEDPLRMQRYKLTLGVDLRSFKFELDYENAQIYPRFHLRLRGTPGRQRQELELEFPFVRSLSAERALGLLVSQEAGVTELKLRGELKESRGLDLFRRDSTLSLQGGLKLAFSQLAHHFTLDWIEKLKLPFESPFGPHQIGFHIRAAWSDREKFSLPLRGYELVGSQLIVASVEYRFPVWAIEAGLGNPDSPWPLFLDDLWGNLLLDVGTAGQTLEPSQLRVGVGLELQLKLVLGYGLVESWLKLGLAYGLGAGEPQIYFNLDFPSL